MNKQKITVVEDQCLGCMKCAGVCPFGAFEVKNGKAYINQELCRGCMKCITICPVEAIIKI